MSFFYFTIYNLWKNAGVETKHKYVEKLSEKRQNLILLYDDYTEYEDLSATGWLFIYTLCELIVCKIKNMKIQL